MHVIILKLRIKPEKVAEFEAMMREHIANTKKGEPGCVEFDIAVDKDEPRTYHFFETYRDDQAIADHAKSESLARVRARLPAMLEDRHYHTARLWPRAEV